MAGQSRSVSVACSYIMKKEGISEKDALEKMRVLRKDAKPIDAFAQQLALFHKYLKIGIFLITYSLSLSL